MHMGAEPVRAFVAELVEDMPVVYTDGSGGLWRGAAYRLLPATQCPRCGCVIEVGRCVSSIDGPLATIDGTGR